MRGASRKRAAALLFFTAALAGAGVVVAAEGPLRLVTTSTDLKALVEAVGGAHVVVESLAPASADPHAHELKPAQLARLKDADLVVRMGLDHEPWFARVRTTVRVVDASRGVNLLQAETPRLRADARPHLHGFGNTHYWLDPGNAKPITATILRELSALRPAYKPLFEDNRRRFVERLDAAMVRWHEAMAPWKGTRAVVMHETWPYFAARFGIAIVGAAEPVAGVPPTPSELAALIARMRSAGVRLLIADSHSDAALVNHIARATAARVVTLAPSVGTEPGTGDYIALFDVNVRRFGEAMGAR